jgi:hypothetical protein
MTVPAFDFAQSQSYERETWKQTIAIDGNGSDLNTRLGIMSRGFQSGRSPASAALVNRNRRCIQQLPAYASATALVETA